MAVWITLGMHPPIGPYSENKDLFCRWRAFTNGRKKALKSKGFIDGDFVETFLDLDAQSKSKCCEGIEGGVDEVHRLIEELSRLH